MLNACRQPMACTCHRQFYLLPLLSLFSALHRQFQDVHNHHLLLKPSAHLYRAMHVIRWDSEVRWPTELHGLAGRPDTGNMDGSCIWLQGATAWLCFMLIKMSGSEQSVTLRLMPAGGSQPSAARRKCQLPAHNHPTSGSCSGARPASHSGQDSCIVPVSQPGAA